MDITTFRNGIFSLNTRRFGSVAEIMIKKLYQFNYSNDINYDLIDSNGKKIEVKFSRAMKSNKRKINEDNIIEECFLSGKEPREMKSEETTIYPFDSNIEQIKCDKFDVLYYGLFFSDVIEIYKINANEIKNCIGYSAKQHGKGIKKSSDEGQFHLNNKTIEFHRNSHLIKRLSYPELYNILK